MYNHNQQYQQQQQAQQPQQQAGLLMQGRIVWTSGKLFEGKPMSDDNGKVILDDQGNATIIYGFGLAIPKVDPSNGQQSQQLVTLFNTMQREALAIYPNGTPNDFAWKYKDGDAKDHNGKEFSDRDGYKNCIVLACTTQIPIKYFRWEGGNNILINDGIKCGDYVNVQLNIKGHPPKGRGKPGLYINPTGCQLVAPGKEIINTPSGDQLFGMGAPVYSAGQVEAPVQSMPNTNMGGMPAMNNQGGMPNQQFNGGGIPQQNTQQAPEHYAVLPGQHQPQQGGMPQQNNQQFNGGGMPQQNNQQFNGGGMPTPNQNNGQQNYQQNTGMPGMPGMNR